LVELVGVATQSVDHLFVMPLQRPAVHRPTFGSMGHNLRLGMSQNVTTAAVGPIKFNFEDLENILESFETHLEWLGFVRVYLFELGRPLLLIIEIIGAS